jgi:hypothetical protein
VSESKSELVHCDYPLSWSALFRWASIEPRGQAAIHQAIGLKLCWTRIAQEEAPTPRVRGCSFASGRLARSSSASQAAMAPENMSPEMPLGAITAPAPAALPPARPLVPATAAPTGNACRLHTLTPETASNCFISREIFYTNWEVNYSADGRRERAALAPFSPCLKIRNWSRYCGSGLGKKNEREPRGERREAGVGELERYSCDQPTARQLRQAPTPHPTPHTTRPSRPPPTAHRPPPRTRL